MSESSNFVLLFSRLIFAIQDLLRVHTNFWTACSISVKKYHWDFDTDGVESVDHFGKHCHLSSVKFSSPCTSNDFPSICLRNVL